MEVPQGTLWGISPKHLSCRIPPRIPSGFPLGILFEHYVFRIFLRNLDLDCFFKGFVGVFFNRFREGAEKCVGEFFFFEDFFNNSSKVSIGNFSRNLTDDVFSDFLRRFYSNFLVNCWRDSLEILLETFGNCTKYFSSDFLEELQHRFLVKFFNRFVGEFYLRLLMTFV